MLREGFAGMSVMRHTDGDVVLIVVREPREECGVVYAHVEGFRMHSMTVIPHFSIGWLDFEKNG